MVNTLQAEVHPQMILGAETAADLMTPNPVSIHENATVADLIALLADRGISAAPVIDDAGRPLGVVTRADVLFHERERARGERAPQVDLARVKDLMTPAVFSIVPDAPASRVVEELLAMKVHRLFVVDHDNSLVGVISALDVLKHLIPNP